MEEDYQSSMKKFWKTVQCLRSGKQCSKNTVFAAYSELLTLTGDIIGRWRQYFKDLLNSAILLQKRTVLPQLKLSRWSESSSV